MSKKKVATTKVTKPALKTQRAKTAAAANPVPVKDVVRPPQAPAAGTATAAGATPAAGRLPAFNKPVSWNFAGVGRNDICPCGSGKRFKNCHGH